MISFLSSEHYSCDLQRDFKGGDGLKDEYMPRREPITESTFAVLLAGIRDHDDACATELYDRLATGIRAIVLHHLRNREDADDGLQICLLAVIEAIRAGRVEDPESLPAYARTVVRRHIAATIRARQAERRCNVDVADAHLPIPAEAEQALYSEEQARLMQAGIEALGEEDRTLLKLYYCHELSADEIASRLGITTETLASRKARAMQRLRQRVQTGNHNGLIARLSRVTRSLRNMAREPSNVFQRMYL